MTEPAPPPPVRASDEDDGGGSLDARWGVALLAAAVVLPLLRQPGVPMWDSIWIEDAPIYTEEANRRGPFAVVLRGYNGYLQLTSRLLAVPTAIVPSRWLAVYLAVSSCVVMALGAAFVYRFTRGWIRSVPVRLTVAAMVVIGPAVAVETTGSITNSIWTLLVVCPWAFIATLERRRDVVMRCVVAFLTAASTVLAGLLLPLAIGAVVVRRTRASVAVLVTFLIGLAIQLVVVRSSPLGPREDNSLRILADFFGIRVLGSFLVGERPLDQIWTAIGEPAAVLAAVVVVVLFAVLLSKAARRERLMVLVLLAYAVILTVVPVLGRGTAASQLGVGSYSLNMTRYTLAPILLLVSSVAILVDPADGADRRPPLNPTWRQVFLVWTWMVIAVSFLTWTVRGDGPSWREQSARVYDTQCRDVPPETEVLVTTSPGNFALALSCRRLGG